LKRAVGYCLNTNCASFAKGIFLLNQSKAFYCPQCRNLGFIVAEKSWIEDTNDGLFKSVRVEFDYDPLNKKYRSIAVVEIPELKFGGTYFLQSPLVKTEKRALMIAETLINNINCYGAKGDILTKETVLSMDTSIKEFRENCAKLEVTLETKARRIQNALSNRND
jgi:hypothetical protein